MDVVVPVGTVDEVVVVPVGTVVELLVVVVSFDAGGGAGGTDPGFDVAEELDGGIVGGLVGGLVPLRGVVPGVPLCATDDDVGDVPRVGLGFVEVAVRGC